MEHGTIETLQMQQDFSIIPVKTRKEEYLRRYSLFVKKFPVEKFVDLSLEQLVFPYKRKAPLKSIVSCHISRKVILLLSFGIRDRVSYMIFWEKL